MKRCILVVGCILLFGTVAQAQTIEITGHGRTKDKRTLLISGNWDNQGTQFVTIKVFIKKVGGTFDEGTVPDINFAKKTFDITYTVDPTTTYVFYAALYYTNCCVGREVDSDEVTDAP